MPHMEYRFYKNARKISEVIELVVDFFEKNDFQVSVSCDNASSFTIVSKNLRDSSFPKIVVKVCSKKDFLSVNLLNGDHLRSKVLLSSIFGLFGGNFFLLRNSEIKEKIDKLEESFWKYLELNL
ncbi:MAG: hypothetical protein ACTSYD_03295 [Candidatus Heimdallarchaeaceae archaeon]